MDLRQVPRQRVSLLFRYLVTLFIPLTTVLTLSTAAAELSETEEFKVIQYKLSDIENLHNKSIPSLSLMALVRGKLKPIPFQIDEYDVVGDVHFEESGTPMVGNKDVIDGEDKLLFMLRDSGPRRSGDELIDGDILSELVIDTDNGGKRYAYIIEGSRLRSDDFHVRYSKDLNQVETDYYSITTNPKNALNWDDIQYFAFNGPQDSPMDTLKIRLSGGLFLPFPRIKLDNDNFIATPYAERVGPVRATTQFKVVWSMFKIPVIDFQMQVHYYPQSLTYSARLDIPRLQRMVLWKPELTLSLDGNNLAGTEIEVPLTPDNKGLVDGKISDQEITMISEGIDLNNNWVNVNTNRALHAMAFFDYIGDTDIPIKLLYMDSKTQKEKPERYAGQGPNIGYVVTDIPKKGFLGMRVNLFFSERWHGEGKHVAKELRSQPQIIALQAE